MGMFRCLFRVTGAKKPLPAKDRGADDKGCEGRRAQKSLPRIAGDIAFPRRNKGNRLKCGAGRTLPGNEPEGRVTKKGYNRICFRVHLYALICSCNLLKSKTGRRMTASFHAVDRGSNPLGDANKRSSVERAFESKFCAFFSIAFLFQKPFQPLLSSLEEACYLPPAAYAASRILLPQIPSADKCCL